MKYHVRNLSASLVLLIFVVLLFSRTALVTAQDDVQHQLGAQIYLENCAICHGLNGEGRIGATLAKNWPSIRPDLATRATIAEGVPGTVMPAWSQDNGGPLNDAEIDAVVAYITSWQTGGAPEITRKQTVTLHPPITPVRDVEGDPNQGSVLYDENCAVCHGPDGEGRIGATLTRNWGSIQPNLAIRSTIARGVTGSVMPAWSQVNGGPLSEDEIDHIVAFILSWSPPAVEPTATPEPQPTSPLSGWWGVILSIVLFVLIIGIALALQNRQKD